jgi:hypothetical protein
MTQSPALAPESSESIAAERRRMRLDQLLAVSRRLGDAIEADIAALEKGEFGELKTTDPEIERLCAFYAREVKALKTEGGIKQAPAPLLAALREAGTRLDSLLRNHERLVTAMRQAAEGLVQAVAEDVERSRRGAAPYLPVPQTKRSSSGAIVYNKVV